MILYCESSVLIPPREKGFTMQRVKLFAVAVLAGLFLMYAPQSRAQISISVNIGHAPVCPYGYFPFRPYRCAPYGYYGPAWFPNGFFIGAGPWFRGPRDFHGYINRDFDPRFGYRGRLPRRGEHERRWRDRGFRGRILIGPHGNRWNGHDNGHHYGQYKHRDYGRGRGYYQDNGRGRGHDRGYRGDHGHGHGHGNGRDHGHGHGHGRDH
jgi:hypothetical protein